MACPSRASRDSTALASAPSSRDVPRASNTASRRRRRPCNRQSPLAGRSEGLLAHPTSASFMRASRAGLADVRHDRIYALFEKRCSWRRVLVYEIADGGRRRPRSVHDAPAFVFRLSHSDLPAFSVSEISFLIVAPRKGRSHESIGPLV
jgi:hypothetical protein